MEYPKMITDTIFAGGTLAVGTTNIIIAKVAPDAQGGGMTVFAAGLCSRDVIAVGSAPYISLVTMGTNSAVTGTIGTVAVAAFTAGTARAMTVTQTFCDADTYIGWQVAGTAANAAQLYVNGWVLAVPGY